MEIVIIIVIKGERANPQEKTSDAQSKYSPPID